MNGYDAVKRAAAEAPELLPLIRACFEYPAEWFKKKWIDPRTAGTLGRLVEVGILERAQPGGADGNALYRFVDRPGAARALDELSASVHGR